MKWWIHQEPRSWLCHIVHDGWRGSGSGGRGLGEGTHSSMKYGSRIPGRRKAGHQGSTQNKVGPGQALPIRCPGAPAKPVWSPASPWAPGRGRAQPVPPRPVWLPGIQTTAHLLSGGAPAIWLLPIGWAGIFQTSTATLLLMSPEVKHPVLHGPQGSMAGPPLILGCWPQMCSLNK